MDGKFYLGVDVGTGSARAGIFDERGVRAGLGTHAVQRWEPQADFHEQSSEDIWRACGLAIKAALKEAGIPPNAIRGIGFDATCSLVVLDAETRPVTVSPTGDPHRNVILWMDHRAIHQAAFINQTQHAALRSVGGTISPEMEAPKLLWLKKYLPDTWSRAAHFMDLADFLSFRATGQTVRSLCTTTCKWNYRAKAGSWDEDFLRTIGLEDLAAADYARIGKDVRPQGERAGVLSAGVARELGLDAGIPVAVSLIDAHAGGVGVLGMNMSDAIAQAPLESRMALICGTSTCHMAVAGEERFVPGVWGPYYSAMIPQLWLAEGGQSASGTLVDHVIQSHAHGAELRELERSQTLSAYEILNRRVSELARQVEFPAQLTRHVHVYADFHGNRSPWADPSLRGMVSGLTLDTSLDSLAVLYLATIQGIAQGTRDIVEQLNRHGYAVQTLIACGGGTKNSLYLQEHADVTGCVVALPEEPEAVLLGAAILGAVASGDQPSIPKAMAQMSRLGRLIKPSGRKVAQYHAAKRKVHALMLKHQRAYAECMSL